MQISTSVCTLFSSWGKQWGLIGIIIQFFVEIGGSWNLELGQKGSAV